MPRSPADCHACANLLIGISLHVHNYVLCLRQLRTREDEICSNFKPTISPFRPICHLPARGHVAALETIEMHIHEITTCTCMSTRNGGQHAMVVNTQWWSTRNGGPHAMVHTQWSTRNGGPHAMVHTQWSYNRESVFMKG